MLTAPGARPGSSTLYGSFTLSFLACGMVRIIGCITELHDLKLVFVAACLCAIGSWTTVALLSRARIAQARLQNLWICASAFVFGLSVWATHFVAMLAFRTPFPVSYDIALTAFSIALAVGISCIGFAVAVKMPWQATGGVIVGIAIGAMHYVGMKAMEGPFRIAWDAHYVVASLLVGAGLAGIALQSKQFVPRPYVKPVKASLLCLGVCSLHFIGMTAVTLIPDPTFAGADQVIAPMALAIAVSAVALLIVALGLASVYLDLYLEFKRADERTRLRAHIAELEATKLELGVALESAYAANKSKSAFLAAMSHELRTPLNAIIGFSDLMMAEPFGPLGHRRYVEYSEDIRKAGAHLLSLINDILDISRLEARKAELLESEIAVPVLLDEAVALVENHARNGRVGLAVECQLGLPHLWADDRRTKQIVLNLLSNAIKFTLPGGSVKVTAALQDGAIVIAVADTGIGIAEADLPKAFESFGQIDNRLSRIYGGSGLGLPLARHLAALHGGTLTIESQLHVGTVAALRFPAQRTLVVPQALSA